MASAAPERYPYPIVMRGVPALKGYFIRQIAAFALSNGAWHRVPIQIDEINRQGDYVLDGGLPYTKGTGNGIYDGSDEFVLSGRDLGEDFTSATAAAFLAESRPFSYQAAWGLHFAQNQKSYGSLLVVAFRGEAPRLITKPLARFNLGAQEIDTPLYRYAFRRDHPALLGQVYLKNSGLPQPVFADSAFRFLVHLPWLLPNFELTDADFSSAIESWQVGPLRTIVAVGVKFRRFLSLFDFHLFSELVFYENLFQIPTIIEFPLDASRYLSPGSGLVYTLRFPPKQDWAVTTNLVDLPAMDADQVFGATVKARPTSGRADRLFYASGRRPEGAFLVKVRVDEKAIRTSPPPFLIRPFMFGNPAWASHWDWLNKTTGNLGLFIDMSGVRRGSYDFGLDLILSSKADETFATYGSAESHWLDLPVN